MSTDDSSPRGKPYLTHMEGALENMDTTMSNVEQEVKLTSDAIDRFERNVRDELRRTKFIMILLLFLFAGWVILLSVYF